MLVIARCAVFQLQGVRWVLQVIMAVIRLQSVASEVLITLNTPMHVSERSAAAEATGAGPKAEHLAAPVLFRQVLATFKIKDYSLFG